MKIKQVLIVIFVLIFGLVIGYKFGLSQVPQVLKSIVEPGSMVTEASYVVFTDGSTVYARNGLTGEIEFQDTNAATVINSALSSLTPGRTWREKVLVKGNLTITAPISLPDYTDFEINGRLIAGTNLANIIKTSGFGGTTANKYVTIHGGIIHGNGALYTVTNAIGYNAWRGSIHDISIIGVDGNAIKFAGMPGAERPFDVKVYNIQTTAISGYGIWFADHAYDQVVTNCFIHGAGLGLNTGAGIRIDYGGQVIGDCHIYDFRNGLIVNASSGNTISNIYFDSIQREAIKVIGSSYWNKYNNIHVYGVGNETENKYDAILLNGTSGIVQHQTFTNIGVDGIAGWNKYRYGFSETGTVSDNSLSFATFDDHYSDTSINVISATLIDVADKNGRRSENSGTTSVTNNDWIAHGLLSTPSSIVITPNNKRITAALTTNSTHFQVGLWDEAGNAIITPEYVSWYAEV